MSTGRDNTQHQRDEGAEEQRHPQGDRSILVASQWQLMWRRLKRHRLAMASLVVLFFIYAMAIFAPFISPYDPFETYPQRTFAPPQIPRFYDPEAGFSIRPFVYGLTSEVDMEARRRVHTIDYDEMLPLHFFVRGEPYNLFGIMETDIRLFGVEEGTAFIFGTDRYGRDMFSRIAHGARISISIGLIGVFISFVLGVSIGGFSGYLGGGFDNAIQRIIEFIRSVPTLPLWMGLSAALPLHWPPTTRYFAIVAILSIIGWTGLARVVRSKFLSMREEDFVVAARLINASERRVIFVHMVPTFLSHIIASLTLSIPGMILGETALSFLGIGLRPPVVSWGVLLQQAQNVATLARSPWLLIPGIFVILTVLAFNFLGDGIRDAADPYSTEGV